MMGSLPSQSWESLWSAGGLRVFLREASTAADVKREGLPTSPGGGKRAVSSCTSRACCGGLPPVSNRDVTPHNPRVEAWALRLGDVKNL
jgi:hypothetical protein